MVITRAEMTASTIWIASSSTQTDERTISTMPVWQVTPIQAVKKVWEKIAPLQLAERSWDNVGIMIG
jgi:hypothetical protein